MESTQSQTIQLECLRDGSIVRVDPAVFRRSQLIKKLGHALPRQLEVPFLKEQVQAWSSYGCRLEEDLKSHLTVLQVRLCSLYPQLTLAFPFAIYRALEYPMYGEQSFRALFHIGN